MRTALFVCACVLNAELGSPDTLFGRWVHTTPIVKYAVALARRPRPPGRGCWGSGWLSLSSLWPCGCGGALRAAMPLPYALAPARSRCGSPVIGIELSSGVEHALSSMCVYSLKIATASVRDFLNQKRLTNSNGFEVSENLNCTCFPPTSRTGQSAPCFCLRRQIRDVEI